MKTLITRDTDRIVQEQYAALREPFLRSFGMKFPAVRRDDLEDIYQNAWIVVWQKLADGVLEHDVPVGRYLFGVAYKLLLNLHRSSMQHLFQSIDTGFDSGDDSDRFNPVAHEMESRLLNEHTDTRERLRLDALVDDMLTQLTERCRDILDKYYYQRLSMREIAAQTADCSSEDSAKTMKSRCLNQLKKATLDAARDADGLLDTDDNSY
jgi:RNA polymerase sigma factor (sigma-70 family)